MNAFKPFERLGRISLAVSWTVPPKPIVDVVGDMVRVALGAVWSVVGPPPQPQNKTKPTSSAVVTWARGSLAIIIVNSLIPRGGIGKAFGETIVWMNLAMNVSDKQRIVKVAWDEDADNLLSHRP